ncbi:MAG: glycosyltransferase family 4 protein [Rhodospirillaceae bacterium]
MRIAYLINSLDGYGAGLPVPMITGFMREWGADVHLFALTRRDGRMEPILERHGLPFDVHQGSVLQSFGWLREKLELYQPTVLWTSLAHATLVGRYIGKKLGLPVVSWQHNVFLKRGNIAALWLTKHMTDLWVADSRCVADVTRSRFGLAADDVTIWPLFSADPNAPRARGAQPDEIFRFGSLGRLHPHKGYDILVRALAKIKEDMPGLAARFTVTIGGDGPMRRELESLSKELRVTNFILAGYQDAPKNFLATLHAYAQPSRVEGLCISAHEAMQAGLPAVVSNMGEMPLTVREGETGYVVPIGDVDALAAALVRVASDPARAALMGEAAHRHVNERFSVARFRAAGADILAKAATLSRK